jgi:hypothetical protein
VVGLDVVHDRDRGLEGEKRLIVFVGLDHVERIAGDSRVPAPRPDPSAGDPCRIAPRCRERFGGHHSRRGLSVRATHRNHRASRDQLGQGHFARYDR